MAFSTSRFLSIALAGALLLAACGSDETIDAAKDTVAETTTIQEATTTVAETTTTVVETTTTAAAVAAGPADGVVFVGPAYTLLISPDWIDASAEFPEGTAGWFTGQQSADFADNVNILTDTVPGSTPLDAILDASITQLQGQFENFALIKSEVVTMADQPDLGLLEYTAMQEGIEIRFVQVFGVWNDTLVVFTGSTDGRLGDDAANTLRPYALTLAPIA